MMRAVQPTASASANHMPRAAPSEYAWPEPGTTADISIAAASERQPGTSTVTYVESSDSPHSRSIARCASSRRGGDSASRCARARREA